MSLDLKSNLIFIFRYKKFKLFFLENMNSDLIPTLLFKFRFEFSIHTQTKKDHRKIPVEYWRKMLVLNTEQCTIRFAIFVRNWKYKAWLYWIQLAQSSCMYTWITFSQGQWRYSKVKTFTFNYNYGVYKVLLFVTLLVGKNKFLFNFPFKGRDSYF